MFKKSFVTFYFLADRLLVAELTKNKKKLKAYTSVELPRGLIESYRVKDIDKLSAFLHSTWSHLNLKEKVVGLVLPEFSTFTKSFKIPKLTAGELQEAVTWQAQEYLPSNLKDMVMDWKKLEEGNGGIHIQIIATEKEILGGYVKACEKAGFFPLVVETPSVCLTRFTKTTDGGVLTVFQEHSETILVISQKDKIVGTSVVYGTDSDEIIKTAAKMVAHYKEVSIQNIFVGGLIDSGLPGKLSDQISAKVSPLKTGLSGTENTIQEYLIPISQQLIEPAEPSDTTSLNLLPSGLVEKYRHENLRIQIWGLTLTASLFIWTSLFVTLGAYIWMVQQLSEMKSTSGASQIAQQRQKALADVRYINKTAKTALTIKTVSIIPQEIFNAVFRAKPEAVTIRDWIVDMDKGTVALTGVSADRTSLIDFKEKLEENKDLGNIKIPVSSFEKDVDLNFNIQLNYLPISSKIVVATPRPTEGGIK